MDDGHAQSAPRKSVRSRVVAALDVQTEKPRIMWLALGALFFFGGAIGTLSLATIPRATTTTTTATRRGTAC